MLQNVATQHKRSKMYESHNVQRHKMYIVTKHKLHKM
jgi:hypothetical protein